MRILIFCALKEEAKPLIKTLALGSSSEPVIYEGELSSHSIRLVVTGMGRENTERACEKFVQYPLPDLIFSCGYTGGLDPRLELGHIVLSSKILVWGTSSSLEPEAEYPIEECWKGLRSSIDPFLSEIHLGPQVTALKIIDQASEKKMLGERFGALAVDMESAWIVDSAKKKNIPFLNLRVISDAVSHDIKIDFSHWFNSEGSICKRAIFQELMRHPLKVFYLIQVVLTTRRAMRRLAGVVKELVLTL
ncbi:MAG: hypothetical protein HYS07_07340 [Chlamydiae bacterium]|nr:hypothetical protein [Chlamydiota bacterium]MBI3276648.1 hypothetical protein [Chlamydiota bacterium]